MSKVFEISGIDLKNAVERKNNEARSGRNIHMHVYGIRLHGYSPETQPNSPDLVVKLKENNELSERYYSIIGYFQKLSDEEALAYDIDYLGIATF